MSILNSQINRNAPDYAVNCSAMRTLVADLRKLLARVTEGGGARAQERHLSRGKLLPRQRIDALIDPGSPFLEIGQLAAHDVYGEDVPAAGLIVGIGRVEEALACADHCAAEPLAVYLSGRFRRRQSATPG